MSIVDDYNKNGYAIARRVIDWELVEEARNHIDWILRRDPNANPEHLPWNSDDPFWRRLVGDHRLLDVAEQFIGPNIALFASAYIAKPPKSGRPVVWHQDGSFWPLEPMIVTSLWLSLDDVTPENGCMRVIPQSHNLDLKELKARSDVDNILGAGIDLSYVDETDAKDILLGPGDVSIHNPNIIHGSNANHSERWRRGLTIRYMPTSTRLLQDEWPGLFLLRGDAVDGINEYAPIPEFDRDRHMSYRGSV